MAMAKFIVRDKPWAIIGGVQGGAPNVISPRNRRRTRMRIGRDAKR